MGSLRFRRSVRLGPGVRLNITKRGVGLSAGVRGARVSVHSSGRRTTSVGIPGSGLSYQHASVAGRSGGGGRAMPPPAPTRAVRTPGLLAPSYEKRFAKGVRAYAEGRVEEAVRLFWEAANADTADRSSSDDLLFGFLLLSTGRVAESLAPLERVVASEHAMPDRLMLDYAPGLSFTTTLGGFATIDLGLDSETAAVMLACAYRALARHDDAIGVLQQLHALDPGDVLVIYLLADACVAVDDWEEVVETTTGTADVDDVTCLVAIARARALRELGLLDAAWEVARATTQRKRHPEVQVRARYERARILDAQGKGAAARKELERIFAIDPAFEDVAARLRGG